MWGKMMRITEQGDIAQKLDAMMDKAAALPGWVP